MLRKGECAMSLVLEFASCVVKNLVNVPEDVMDGWVNNPKALQKALTSALCPPQNGPAKANVPNINLAEAYKLLGMSQEYQEASQKFNLTEDPNLWKVLILKEVTCNKLVEAYKKAGVKMYLYTNDLDKEVQDNQRNPNRDGDYLVSFKRNVESDEENANQSAGDRKANNCQDNTLAERLLLGLAYFLATGGHLDAKNWTLCSGSRFQVGFVPSVFWNLDSAKVEVSWYRADSRYDLLRSRSVVSLSS